MAWPKFLTSDFRWWFLGCRPCAVQDGLLRAFCMRYFCRRVDAASRGGRAICFARGVLESGTSAQSALRDPGLRGGDEQPQRGGVAAGDEIWSLEKRGWQDFEEEEGR
eukprot:3580144-Pleurochrysis_carterae.AAC.1